MPHTVSWLSCAALSPAVKGERAVAAERAAVPWRSVLRLISLCGCLLSCTWSPSFECCALRDEPLAVTVRRPFLVARGYQAKPPRQTHDLPSHAGRLARAAPGVDRNHPLMAPPPRPETTHFWAA